ncbi:MAG: tRNA dihydrouridine synthase DusB [candidate division KSB1 bacterium]|nr:tRNA dihydrouridine synthase DusB [candidate division KSB1 bacterium]MDZ7334488.1 tRNA dihydrouridine synthase DusB [candidate division KSB1 bacterium]MDZ7401003.1 tRNA dihydrouridine synthase DusB [candidate division KSB1 bacterium]
MDGRVILAPLAGISDSTFRNICRGFGAAMVFSEMISVDGLLRNNRRTLEYVFFRESERPIGFQLFGSDPDTFVRALSIIEPFQPDVIDLNFGCPVRKVVKRGAGAALLKDIDRLEEIARAVVQHSSRPVMAKIRKGWDNQSNNALEVAKRLEQCGVAAITIHPRTQTQGYAGRADWETIATIKRELSLPIIGSGDVRSGEDAQRMIDETGCDLVMIGRASLGNPWIFQQANHFLTTGHKLPAPSLEQRLEVIQRHLADLVAVKGERIALREIRKHLGWYLKGLPNSGMVRNELFQIKAGTELMNHLIAYFAELSNYD